MPTNLYGLNDNYDPLGSHVLPALIRRFHEAKAAGAPGVTCWGTGAPLREFLYSDDLGRACVFLMQNYSQEQFINVGSGAEVSIRELAETVKRVVGYEGRDSLGQNQAGRHAAQIAGQLAPFRPGLEAAGRPGGRSAPGLRGLSQPLTLVWPWRCRRSNSMSASTISLTRSANRVLGSQPSCRRALLLSPMSKSTSAGRK